MKTLLILANTIACVVILWNALCAISRMDRKTHWTVRWSYVLLATGAFAGLCTPPDTWLQGAGMAGVATVMVANRRERCGDCVSCVQSHRPVTIHDRRIHG